MTVTDELGIDRRGLYYWCNYDHRAPLHSTVDCPGLNRLSEERKQKYMNETIIRGSARGINFCSMCCERGGETPSILADEENYSHLELEASG